MKSAYLAKATLNWAKGCVFPAPPSQLYLSLHGSMLDATGADEITAHLFRSPERFLCPQTLWGAVVGPDSAGQCWLLNADDLILGSSRCSEPVPIHGIGLWDAPTDGQLIVRGSVLRDPNSLQQPAALPGQVVLFAAGRIKLILD